MASVHLTRREARVFTTPDELRALADRMDEQWDDTLPGGDLTGAAWISDDLLIYIVIDQGSMPRPAATRAWEERRRKKVA